MADPGAHKPIERSKPTYARSLLLAGVVFAGLLCGNLFVFGHLAFLDLGSRVYKEAISGASARALQLAQALAEQGRIDLYRIHERSTILSEYVEEVLTRERHVTTVTLYDAEDRPVLRWTQRWGTLIRSGPGFHQPRMGRRPVEEHSDGAAGRAPGTAASGTPTFRVNMREQDRYIAVPIPGPDGSGFAGAVEVGIDEQRLGREIDELRRSLLIKIVVGAALSVLLLLVAFVYVVRLLRKTRRLEAEAQMADRLAYVGTLASGLAHEIRNPLNAMNMNLQMLEEELAAASPHPDAAALLESTKTEVRRLEVLVNDFLAYARPSAPRLESRDLNETVDGVVRFVRAELQQKGIRIEASFDASVPSVEIDEAQIRQALLNILINAKDVLGPGGRIEVATAMQGPDDLIVRIRDTGPGIAPDVRGKIFEVFYSTRGGGTGLGLPIAQRIVESHGGWIEVESEPGQGATFILHLPRSRRPEGGTMPAPAPAR